jgi:hypothetical protein
MVLQGCANVPQSDEPSEVYVKSFTKTDSGCYVGMRPGFYSKITWTGECYKGLAFGKGVYTAYKKANPAEIEVKYEGMMSRGSFDGYGKHTSGDKVRIGTFYDSYHESSNRGKFIGREFIKGQLEYEGEFTPENHLVKGKVFFSANGYIDGEYLIGRAEINLITGKGVVSGKRYPESEFKSVCDASTSVDPKLTPTQKQEYEDKCLYGKVLIEKPPIGGYFQGKAYNSMAALNQAQNDFAKAKAERERIEAIAEAERARVQAVADAERARVRAVAEAERVRRANADDPKVFGRSARGG